MKKLNEIAPLWNAKLEEDLHNITKVCEKDGHTLNIEDWQSCVLGEAYGFSAKYSDVISNSSKDICEECDSIASRFAAIGDMIGDFNDGAKTYELYNHKTDQYDELILSNRTIKSTFNKTVKRFEKHWNENHLGK